MSRDPWLKACACLCGSVALLVLSLCASCRREAGPVSAEWPIMGTFASVSVPAQNEAVLADCRARVGRIFDDYNARLSTYVATSDVSRLNAAAGGAPVAVADETEKLLELVRYYGTISDGAFDVAVAPLMQLWGFRGGEPPDALPRRDVVAGLLPLVDDRLIDVEAGEARLSRTGMRIDLGGIAKGFAVDAAYEALVTAGHRNVLVNLGGNMRGTGQGRVGRGWRVGVRHPFDRGRLVGVIALPDGHAVATSGNYEKFVEIDGQRYAHIMDPRSGMPVQGMAGVTVLSQRGVAADALATALFVAGMEDAQAIIDRVPDAEFLLIPDAIPLAIHVTPGFATCFEPLPEFRRAVHIMARQR